MPRPRLALTAVVALIALELVAVAGDLLLGPWTRIHWEERINIRAGLLVACGHLDLTGVLQYKSFCGGCTAEGLIAAPLFRTVGPSVLVWKLIPAAFHAAVLGAGAALAWRTAGAAAAAGFVALMAAAPGFYRDLTLTGWGNHAESEAFPLIALALLAASGGRIRGGLAGLVTGLGLWFCHTSVHALPAVLAAAALRGRATLIAVTAAIPVGALPWWIYHHSRPRARSDTWSWWTGLELAPLNQLAEFLWGRSMREGLWFVTDYGPTDLGPGVWWAGFWLLALAGVAVGLSRSAHARRVRPAGLAYAGLGLLTLLVVYGLRIDLWKEQLNIFDDPMFNLRYRIPLIPTLAFGAALSLAAPRVPRLFAAAAVLGLSAYGLNHRLHTWTTPRWTVLGLRAWGPDGAPDGTVPIGDPPMNLRRKQGRQSDIDAAFAWLSGHEDALPECRWHHVFELGRRLGLGLTGAQTPDPLPAIERALALSPDQDDRRFLAAGIARGMEAATPQREDWISRDLARLEALQAGLGEATARAIGRERSDSLDAERGRPADLHPQIWLGVCDGRGERRASLRSGDGLRWPPQTIDRPGLVAMAGDCLALDAYWEGLGWGWGRRVGCTMAAQQRLAFEAEERLPLTADGYAAACRIYRTRPLDLLSP